MSSKHGLQRGVLAIASQVYRPAFGLELIEMDRLSFLTSSLRELQSLRSMQMATTAFEMWVAQAHFERVGW